MEKKTKNRKTFQVRDSKHKILGTFVQRELFLSILEGNFDSEDEISLEGTGHWQKISSHPDFYDAFIKRLYSKDYVVPPQEASIQSSQSENLNELKKKEPTFVLPQGTRTEHLQGYSEEAGQKKEPIAHTIHQADIEKLFQDSVSQREKSKENNKTKISPSTLQERSESTGELPLISKNIHGEEAAPPTSFHESRYGNRRVLLWAGFLGILLLVLFQMGGTGTEESTKEGVSVPNFLHIRAKEVTPEKKASLLLALEYEYIFYLTNDGTVFVEGAYETAQEALEYEPSSSRFLGLLAIAGAHRVAHGIGDSKVATVVRNAIEKGRKEDPQSSLFYRAEAILAAANGNWKEAREKIESAKESDPTGIGNLLLDAEIDIHSGKSEEAIRKLIEVIQDKPNYVRAHYLLGKIYVDKNQLGLAWEQGITALSWNPIYSDAFYLLGEVQAKRNLLQEARLSFDQATRFGAFGNRATVASAHVRLGELLQIMSKSSEAEKSFALAYQIDPTKYPDYKSKMGNPEKEERAQLIKEWRYETAFYREQGDELLKKRQFRKAIVFFQGDRLLRKNDATSYVRVGQVLEKVVTSKEEIDRVMLLYERGAVKDPSNILPYVRLGVLESEQYNFERAYQLLDYARSLNAQNGDVLVALGKHFFRRQDYLSAKDYFTAALVVDSTSSDTEYHLAMISRFYDKEELREPMRRFRRAFTLDPENYQALAEYSKLRVLNYEKIGAIKEMKARIADNPSNPELHWVLGEIYASNSEPRRAIENYKRGLDIDPNNSKLRMSLARANAATGAFEAAVDEYRKAAELDPKNNDGRFEAAKVLYELQRFDLAELELQKILDRTPNFPGVHRYLSKVYQMSKRKDISAEKQIEMAQREMEIEVENSPRNTRFILELATLYISYKKYEKAIQPLSEVANLPSDSKTPDVKKERMRAFLLLSVCYRALNKPENAEGAIRLALTLDPNEPELHRELGHVYHAQQRFLEAKEAFEYYLNRVPAATDVDEIRTIIRRTVGD